MHGSSAVVSCFNAPPLLYDLSQAAPQPEPLPVCNLVAPTEVECKGCAAFAPGGGVIAVGSNKGTLSLAWRDGKTNTWMAFDAATLAKPEVTRAPWHACLTTSAAVAAYLDDALQCSSGHTCACPNGVCV